MGPADLPSAAAVGGGSGKPGRRVGKVVSAPAAGRDGAASRVAHALDESARQLATQKALALLEDLQGRAEQLTGPWYHAGLVYAAWPPFLADMACAAGALCLLGCAESAAYGPLPGASNAWAQEPAQAASVARETGTPAVVPEARDAGARSWPLASPVPFLARGHLPEQAVEVRVNDLALAAYRGLVPDTVFPDGSELAQLSTTGTGPGYLMRKTAGKWLYSQLDSQGRIRPGDASPRCAACHAQAQSDRVFGMPWTLPGPPGGS